MTEANGVGRRRGNAWVSLAWVAGASLLLLAPLVAMQVTDEVDWTLSDFVLAGAVLVGSGLAYEVAARFGGWAYRGGVVLALGAAVLILWSTGAVGIIGSEANPGNLLFLGVAAAAGFGALLVRGRAAKLRWVMSAAALAQLLVPVIAWAGVAKPREDALQPEVLAATALLTAMWLGAAWLFVIASRRDA